MRVLEEFKYWTNASCPGKVLEPCLPADLTPGNVPEAPESGEEGGGLPDPTVQLCQRVGAASICRGTVCPKSPKGEQSVFSVHPGTWLF